MVKLNNSKKIGGGNRFSSSLAGFRHLVKNLRQPEVGKCKNAVILSDSEKSLTKKTCHPELDSGSIHLIGKSSLSPKYSKIIGRWWQNAPSGEDLIDSGSESGMTVKKCKNACHPEALAEGSLANTLCPPLVQTGIEVSSAEVRSEVTCVAPEIDEFRGGQLLDMDSSVVSLPQNDCNVALGRDFSQTSFAQNDCKKKKAAFTLAEGATHVDMPPTLAKAGFTLAEVLITLGIIGVVAAMTIPNLIANTKGQQYRTKFKKAISTLSQAGLMAQAKYDFDYAGVSAPCIDPATDNPEEIMSICALLNGTLTGHTYLGRAEKLYPNGIQMSTIGDIYEFGIAYSLADGSVLVVYRLFDSCKESSIERVFCWGFIDINGVSLPNKEVSCTKGETSMLNGEDCVVTNNPNNLTDIYPIWFHDSTVEPLTNAAYYVLHGHTGTRKWPIPK